MVVTGAAAFGAAGSHGDITGGVTAMSVAGLTADCCAACAAKSCVVFAATGCA
ncbi:hypothetical protein D3C81_1875480 [compost metagenome]